MCAEGGVVVVDIRDGWSIDLAFVSSNRRAKYASKALRAIGVRCR